MEQSLSRKRSARSPGNTLYGIHLRSGRFLKDLPRRNSAILRDRPNSFLDLRSVVLSLTLCTVALTPSVTMAQAQNDSDLTQVSLEDLMNIKVTSVSRKEQKLSKVAAAIYVITQDDIRRSGAKNIPDLLRMVPGLDVAQIDANSWAISSRGFNDGFADKLLVLVDGRSAYDPLFSGVYWDQQSVPLEDIERIEVIRGPGATVWGANAVNGVVNIITKSSKVTQGGLLVAAAGSKEAHGLIQYGGKIGRKGTYRVFTGYDDYHRLVDSLNRPAADSWHLTNGGFRSDFDLTKRDSLTVEGELLTGRESQADHGFVSLAPPLVANFNDSIRPGAGSILGRWSHNFSSRSDMALQVYYDGISRTEFGGRERWRSIDVDFQHHLALGSHQDLLWGVGYRSTSDSFRPGFAISLHPPSLSENLSSAFIQDEFSLSDSLHLTLGSKFEHNRYTGFEVQPGARLVWSPVDHETAWAAVSRAIRQPARDDEDVRYNVAAFPGANGLNTLVSLLGNPRSRSEELIAYELGYRLQPASRVSLDFTTFYNVYHSLRTVEPGTPAFETTPSPPHILVPQMFGNKMHGQTYGAEVSADWNVVNRWKLSGSYSWLKMSLHLDPSSLDASSTAAVGESPRHQFQVRSYLTLPQRLEFDSELYYVDSLPAMRVPSYERVDARLAWHARESIELAVVGQNLLDDRHFEFGGIDITSPTQAKRSVYGELTWRFQ